MKPIPLIEIVLDKPRKLALTMGAQFLIEDRINKSRGVPPSERMPFLVIIEGAWRQNDFHLLPLDLLQISLWACLLHEDPELKFEAVREMMTDIVYINGKVVQVFATLFPKNLDDAGEASSQSPLSSTGSNSGALPGSS